MNIQDIKLWRVALVGLSVLVILGLSLFGCINYYLKYKSALNGLQTAESNMRIYTAVVDGQRENVYETRLALVATQRKLELSQDQVERLKQTDIRRVQAIGELELNISSYRDSLLIYKKVDTEWEIVDIEETEHGPMLPLPASFGSQDSFLVQQAIISEHGLGSISFELSPVELDITLGSRGIWKKSYISAVSTNNPYVQVTESSWQMIEPKKTITPVLIAGTAGVLIGGVVAMLLMGL